MILSGCEKPHSHSLHAKFVAVKFFNGNGLEAGTGFPDGQVKEGLQFDDKVYTGKPNAKPDPTVDDAVRPAMVLVPPKDNLVHVVGNKDGFQVVQASPTFPFPRQWEGDWTGTDAGDWSDINNDEVTMSLTADHSVRITIIYFKAVTELVHVRHNGEMVPALDNYLKPIGTNIWIGKWTTKTNDLYLTLTPYILGFRR